MIKNYLKIAFRNLLKNKSYVIINTFGLGIALACCVTAYMLIAYNMEFDNFHKDEKIENIYRIHSHVKYNDGNLRMSVGCTSPMAKMATEDISGIKRYTRFAYGGANVSFGVERVFSEGISFADSTFFEMFDFPFVKGSQESFKELQTILLNEELAEKYFGDEDPIGKIMDLSFQTGLERKFVVGGVFERIPINSSLTFRALIRAEHYQDIRERVAENLWRDWNIPTVFVELTNPREKEDIAQFMDKYKEHRNEAKVDQELLNFSLQPFKSEIDFNTVDWAQINGRIPTEPLVIFITMAVLILLIACFNLTNTSIAVTTTRLKEIGVRKSLGAYKGQIIVQFLFETIILMGLAVIMGWIMAQIIVPQFTTMWDWPYGLDQVNGFNLFLMLLLLLVFASVLSGIYPALFNSRFNTVTLLKGTVRIKGTNLLTRTLVSAQFAISVIVLIAGVSFTQNAKYQEKVQFGYDKENVVTVDIQDPKAYYAMKTKALSNPKVENVAVSDHQVGMNTYPSPVKFEEVDYEMRHIGVGENYFETMGFTFIQGRSFNMDRETEVTESIVITKETISYLGMQGDPIGQEIYVHSIKRKVIGVIDNFVDNIYRSADPEPLVFYPATEEWWKRVIVRTDPDDLAEVNEYLEESWKELYPTQPYNSQYQEDVLLENTKQLNGNMTQIFLFLTILGAALSVSGIFSLASLNIARRTKEIGIRKALGSSVKSVVLLLNREFFIILAIAGVLGSLGGYFGVEALLDNWYAFYKSADVLSIVLCALFIFGIGIATTSMTIFGAAKANPVDTLRDE